MLRRLPRGRSAARRRTRHHRRPACPATLLVVAVICMPRTSGKSPHIVVGPVRPIGLTDQDWQRLEAALGQLIPEKARADIIFVTNWFLRFAEAESTVGLMKNAFKRIERLRTRAQSFRTTIEEGAVGDPTRDYVDDTLAMSYARLTGGDIEREYVVQLSTDLSRFLDACDLTLQRLEEDAQRKHWPKGGAWEGWIRDLTGVLQEDHLPIGARKDKSRDKSGTTSPFVAFVFEFQTLLPKKYRRSQHSTSALAVSIHNARRHSKTVAPRGTRARTGS
jgi:hypothetical protein